jgi:hypothetical protein
VKYLHAFLTSCQAVLARYFSDRTQQALAFQALTLGLPPALLPGIYSFLPYGELRSPHYPRGGMIQIPRTLQRLGERHGMRVQLGARVTKVLVERRRAIGVQLADGTEIRSDVVVSNINAKTLYQNLIGTERLPWLVQRGVRTNCREPDRATRKVGTSMVSRRSSKCRDRSRNRRHRGTARPAAKTDSARLLGQPVPPGPSPARSLSSLNTPIAQATQRGRLDTALGCGDLYVDPLSESSLLLSSRHGRERNLRQPPLGGQAAARDE